MLNPKSHPHVIHPKELLKKEEAGAQRFNTSLAVRITKGVGSMWTAYVFTFVSLFSLPAVLTLVFPGLSQVFPSWLIATGVVALIAWISQNFIQLVLLPIIMVGQNVIQSQNDAKAEVDHKTLTYLANLQDEQMVELKNQGKILELLKRKAEDRH